MDESDFLGTLQSRTLTLRLYSKAVAPKTSLLTSSAGVVVPAPNITSLVDTVSTMALGFKVRGDLTMVGLTEGESVFRMLRTVSAPVEELKL